MKRIPLENNVLTLPGILKLAKGGTVVLTRKGKPVVAVKDVTDSDWEAIALANNRRFQAIIDESRESYRREGGIPLESVRKQLGLTSTPSRRRRTKAE